MDFAVIVKNFLQTALTVDEAPRRLGESLGGVQPGDLIIFCKSFACLWFSGPPASRFPSAVKSILHKQKLFFTFRQYALDDYHKVTVALGFVNDAPYW